MTIVPTHSYFLGGISSKRAPEVLKKVMLKSIPFQKKGLPYIHSLQHLAQLLYIDLSQIVRLIKRDDNNYYHYRIPKRSGGYRFISSPSEELKKTQRWINCNILNKITPHERCYSFHRNASIYNCALAHCRSKWLIKLDVETFFDMTSELDVYKQFLRMGYSKIVSLALARVCTYEPNQITINKNKWIVYKRASRNEPFPRGKINFFGRLPQGAPTSPMLSNLAFYNVDEKINKLANENSAIYTRYADDIFISFSDGDINREKLEKIIGRVSSFLSLQGYSLNKTKIKIIPPGGRKNVLGLNIESDKPQLSKAYKKKVYSHLYGINKFGPVAHSKDRGFDSVFGMLEHIKGKVNFARIISKEHGDKMNIEFESALEKFGFK